MRYSFLLVVCALLFPAVVLANQEPSEDTGNPATEAQPVEIDAGDYGSLHEAAAAIPPQGGLLRIPPGIYELREPLVIKTGDTAIQGAGAATHIRNLNEEGQPAIVIENPEFHGRATPGSDRLWRIQVTNLRVTGNEKSGSGIVAHYVEEVFLQAVTISDHGENGIYLDHCYEDPRISDNLITYNKANGVLIEGGHDIVVSANHFEENQTGLRCLDSFNLAMSGNNLDDHLGDGVVVENTYGSFISSNMIEECQGWGIVLDRDVYGTTIAANVIAHEFTGGIDLRDAHGCAISANTFTIVKNVGLAIRKQSGAITVTGNNFSDSWIGHDEQGREISKRDPNKPTKMETNSNEAAGVLLDGCEAIVLSGNLFSRLTTEPIERRGKTREILIEGNGAHLAR